MPWSTYKIETQAKDLSGTNCSWSIYGCQSVDSQRLEHVG